MDARNRVPSSIGAISGAIICTQLFVTLIAGVEKSECKPTTHNKVRAFYIFPGMCLPTFQSHNGSLYGRITVSYIETGMNIYMYMYVCVYVCV